MAGLVPAIHVLVLYGRPVVDIFWSNELFVRKAADYSVGV
jgi:hypothetical protein